MDQATARVVNTTTANYLREEEVNILRNRRLTALIQARGRIKYNVSGTKLDWKVRYKRVPIQGYADADTLAFPRRDRWKTATLPWRGYAITDSQSKMESLMNRGTEAIIKIYSQVAENLKDDIEDAFGEELYLDGNLAANAKRIHGLESFFGATLASGAKAATPNDTYAGLSTVLGTYGGAWSGTWPDGRGDAHYDFWSPVVVQYLQNAFGVTNGDTWAENCLRALRFGTRVAMRNKGKRGQQDLVLLDGQMYEDTLNALDDKERLVVTRGKRGGLVDLGFSDVLFRDGAEITWEYGIPAETGYGLNIAEIELDSMQEQLFVPDGPDWDISSRSWRFAIDFLGNLRMNPRYFTKYAKL